MAAQFSANCGFLQIFSERTQHIGIKAFVFLNFFDKLRFQNAYSGKFVTSRGAILRLSN